MYRKTILAALAACFTALSGAAQAATLYGSEYSGFGFYQIDISDGSHTTLPITKPRANGLAHQSSTNSLISMGDGVLNFYDLDDSSESSLAITGATGFLTGLAFNAAQSILYSIGGSNLYGIDVVTGAATVLNASISGFCCSIAVRSDGVIFKSSTDAALYSYDPNNNYAQTYLGQISGLNIGTTSMDFDENDVLYAINTVPDTLVTIDIDTLTATTIGGDIGTDVRGLTFTRELSPVPVPASLPLLALGVAAFAGLRKRSAARG